MKGFNIIDSDDDETADTVYVKSTYVHTENGPVHQVTEELAWTDGKAQKQKAQKQKAWMPDPTPLNTTPSTSTPLQVPDPTLTDENTTSFSPEPDSTPSMRHCKVSD